MSLPPTSKLFPPNPAPHIIALSLSLPPPHVDCGGSVYVCIAGGGAVWLRVLDCTTHDSLYMGSAKVVEEFGACRGWVKLLVFGSGWGMRKARSEHPNETPVLRNSELHTQIWSDVPPSPCTPQKGNSIKIRFFLLERLTFFGLKDHISLTMLHEGFQKEGITDCVVRPLGQRTILLTVTNNGSLHKLVKDKEMVFAQWFGNLHPWSKQDTGASRIAWLTCGFILTKVKIKVDGDDFLITVTEDSALEVDRRGDETHGLKDHQKCTVSASSTGTDSCYRGARANDESGSVHMGSVALPQDVMGRLIDSGGISRKHRGKKTVQAPRCALHSEDSLHSDTLEPTERSSLGFSSKAHSQLHGVEVLSNGPGDKGANLAGLNSIDKPSAGPPYIKLVSRPTKHAQKKHMEDILQLRLSKRVIRKGKKNRKVELTNLIGDDTRANFGASSFGDSLHDSHIMNRNQVLMAKNEHLGIGNLGLSPSAICPVLSQLGVVKENNVKETIQRIADMEKRDTLLFSRTEMPKRTGKYKVSQSPP
ncbi:hypothetical protein Ancab_007474 [Ancistrocladus abbreviatus]